jgi:hypothetical protein
VLQWCAMPVIDFSQQYRINEMFIYIRQNVLFQSISWWMSLMSLRDHILHFQFGQAFAAQPFCGIFDGQAWIWQKNTRTCDFFISNLRGPNQHADQATYRIHK